MKTGTIYIRILALTLVLMTTVNIPVNSKGKSSKGKSRKEGDKYVGIIITPQKTNIRNKDFSASTALDHKNGTSVNLAIESGYFISKEVGISIGAGMSSYSTKFSLDTCSFNFQDIDSDNESYEMMIKGESIKESQKTSFLSIPICLVLRYPAGDKDDKIEFYAKTGISFDIPIVKTYKGSGTFSYSGYYSRFPVLLQDIPAYFPSNVNTSSSDDLDIKSFIPTLVASVGASYKINKSIQVTLGFSFNRSLGNMSAYSSGSDYKLTSKPNELNSIMGGTSKAGIQGFGVSLGVRYYIK